MSECSREMRKGNNLDPVAEMLKPFECNVCAKSYQCEDTFLVHNWRYLCFKIKNTLKMETGENVNFVPDNNYFEIFSSREGSVVR